MTAELHAGSGGLLRNAGGEWVDREAVVDQGLGTTVTTARPASRSRRAPWVGISAPRIWRTVRPRPRTPAIRAPVRSSFAPDSAGLLPEAFLGGLDLGHRVIPRAPVANLDGLVLEHLVDREELLYLLAQQLG
jgi:hypothetical protein